MTDRHMRFFRKDCVELTDCIHSFLQGEPIKYMKDSAMLNI